MVITNHAKQRIQERIGKKIPIDIADKALQSGIKHSEVKGSLRRFIDGIYLSNCKINNARIYNNFVFCFRGEVLITVINLPQKFIKTVNEMKK